MLNPSIYKASNFVRHCRRIHGYNSRLCDGKDEGNFSLFVQCEFFSLQVMGSLSEDDYTSGKCFQTAVCKVAVPAMRKPGERSSIKHNVQASF